MARVTFRTLAKVKSWAISPRHPSVPNLISVELLLALILSTSSRPINPTRRHSLKDLLAVLFLRSDHPWGPHQPHPMVVGADFRLRPRGSNQSEVAKCGRDGASHPLILVLKGSWPIEWTTIHCGRFPTG